MIVVLPDDTLARERARNVESFSPSELLIAIAGDVVLTVGGEERLAFRDVPLLGFAAELAHAVRRIVDGAPSASFIGFYGDCQIAITRIDAGVRVEDVCGGGAFTTDVAVLAAAVRRGAEECLAEVASALPAVARSPAFHAVRDEVLAAS